MKKRKGKEIEIKYNCPWTFIPGAAEFGTGSVV
jgi:hypothetical protein